MNLDFSSAVPGTQIKNQRSLHTTMNPHSENIEQERIARLKTVMVFRVVFLTAFVALILPLQLRMDFNAPIRPLTLVISAGYLLSIVYALGLKLWRPFPASVVQVIGDLVLVGAIMHVTGGTQSPLSFLFIFVILGASVLFPRAGCYFVASGASIIYGLLIDLEYFNLIQPYYLFHEPTGTLDGGYVFYLIFLNIASYYSVAFLAGLLNQRLRTMNEELALTSKDLQELQAFHRSVVRDMGTGLITTDGSGRITSVNQAAEEITGYNYDESLGVSFEQLLPIQDLRNLFRNPHSVSLPLQIEGECKRKDGKDIFIRMKVSRFSNLEERMKGYICVFEDLTSFREMQEKMSQAERLAAVGRFSAGLAHEIRNPLASLSGSIQVLSKGMHLENKHKALMDIVLRETDRLNSILTDFLNYSNPKKNRITLVDLTQLVEDVITLIKNNDRFKSAMNIEFNGDSDHLIMSADEPQIKQLVWNLCINGLQSMTAGGTLKISLKKVDHAASLRSPMEKRGYLLTVEDEGCGIPQDQLKKIFDPFYTTKENGVGLGLPTVYQIVQRSGGTIEVSSQLDRGTQFRVYLPRGVLSNIEEPVAVAQGI